MAIADLNTIDTGIETDFPVGFQLALARVDINRQIQLTASANVGEKLWPVTGIPLRL